MNLCVGSVYISSPPSSGLPPRHQSNHVDRELSRSRLPFPILLAKHCKLAFNVLPQSWLCGRRVYLKTLSAVHVSVKDPYPSRGHPGGCLPRDSMHRLALIHVRAFTRDFFFRLASFISPICAGKKRFSWLRGSCGCMLRVAFKRVWVCVCSSSHTSVCVCHTVCSAWLTTPAAPTRLCPTGVRAEPLDPPVVRRWRCVP